MAIVSADRRIRKRNGQATGRTGNTKEQSTFRTAGFAADGFLKQRFLPLYQPSETVPDQQQVEQGFFKSLSILTGLYGLTPMDVSDKPYPYNILLAHWDMTRQLNTGHQPVELSIVQDDHRRVNLAATQTYNTGTTLYYIPVLPLYRLLQDKRQKHCAELLLSVCAYLCHSAGVPYYGDNYSALAYYYDMAKEWLLEDAESWEKTELNSNISELNAAEYFGEVMGRKLFNRYQLSHFQERIDRFKAADGFQNDCLALARIACELYRQYPERSIFNHITPLHNEEDEMVAHAEQYISFIADNKGWLFDNVVQMVENELNECSLMEEPSVTQLFDSTALMPDEGLEFEHRIFDLITDLCTLLNQLP